MKVRGIILLLIVLVVSSGVVNAASLMSIKDAGICHSEASCTPNPFETEDGQIYHTYDDSRFTGDVCKYDDGDGYNYYGCEYGLDCINYEDNAYCVPDVGGCVDDSHCNANEACDPNDYLCKGPLSYGENCLPSDLCEGSLECLSFGWNLDGVCEFPVFEAEVGDSCDFNYECGNDLMCIGNSCQIRTLTEEGYDNSTYYSRGSIRSNYLWDMNVTSIGFSEFPAWLHNSRNKRDFSPITRVWYAEVTPGTEVTVSFSNDGSNDALDGRVYFAAYDMKGKRIDYFFENTTWHGTATRSITIPQSQNTNSNWYKFIFAFKDDVNTGFEAYINARLQASEDYYFSHYDSGKFTDSNGEPINFEGHKTSEVSSDSVSGHSFYLEYGETKLLDNFPFNIGNAVVSCEFVNPEYYVDKTNGRVIVKALHNMPEPVLCNVFVWSDDLENNDLANIYFDSLQTIPSSDEFNPTLLNFNQPMNWAMLTCSQAKPGITTIPSNSNVLGFYQDIGDASNCGMIAFSQNHDENSYVDLQGIRFAVEKENTGSSDYQENFRDVSFEGFENLDGAVVSCNGRTPRYNIYENVVYLYGEANMECTIVAWQYQEPPEPFEREYCDEIPANNCDDDNEGVICLDAVSNSVRACVWNELLEKYGFSEGQDWFYSDMGKNSAFPVKHRLLIGEGRDDIVSDYNNFYTCSEIFGSELMVDGVIPPPSDKCNELVEDLFGFEVAVCEDGVDNCCPDSVVDYTDLHSSCFNECDLVNSTSDNEISEDDICSVYEQIYQGELCESNVEEEIVYDEGDQIDSFYECTNSIRDTDNYITDLCVYGCVDGASLVYTDDTANSDEFCCKIVNSGDNPDPCLSDPPQAPEGSILMNPFEVCDEDEIIINNDRYCTGTVSLVSVPSNYNPVICNQKVGDFVAFSCDNNHEDKVYSLTPGMSSGKISNQSHNSYDEIYYTEGTVYLGDEGLIHYDELIQKNWSGAALLEFDFKAVDCSPTSTECHLNNIVGEWFPLNLTNVYLKSDNKYYLLGSIKEFMLRGETVLSRIRLPLLEELKNRQTGEFEVVNYEEIDAIAVGTTKSGTYIFHPAKFSNINLIYGDEKICGNIAFVDDMDDISTSTNELASKTACNYPGNPTEWTGTRCCGDDIYYGDIIIDSPASVELIANNEFDDEIFVSGETPIVNGFWYLHSNQDSDYPQFDENSVGGFLRVAPSNEPTNSFYAKQRIHSSDMIGPLFNFNIRYSNCYEDYCPYITNKHRVQIIGFKEGGEVSLRDKYLIGSLIVGGGDYSEEFFITDYESYDYFDLIISKYISLNNEFLTVYGVSLTNTEVINPFTSEPSFEFYNDTNGLCFSGVPIIGDSLLRSELDGEYDELLYSGDALRYCDFYGDRTYSDILKTNNDGSDSDELLISESNHFSICDNYAGFICTGEGWQNWPVTFELRENLLDDESGNNLTTNDGHELVQGLKVYCEGNELAVPQNRSDWYINNSAPCAANSCYCPDGFAECEALDSQDLRYGECISNGSYAGNHYCYEGAWTTRNAFASRFLFEKASDEKVISCGVINKTLNNQISGPYTDACFYSNLEEEYANQEIIVSIPLESSENYESLNRFISEEFGEIYSHLLDGQSFNAQDCLHEITNDPNEFSCCNAGNLYQDNKQVTICFDKNLEIVYFGNYDFMSSSPLDGFFDFWRNLFGLGEELSIDEVSFDFSEVYFYEKDDNVIKAYSNDRANGGPLYFENKMYYDFQDDEELELSEWISSVIDSDSVRDGEATNTSWQSNNRNLWYLLTSASRYDLN